MVFHYAQETFEGMKAYRHADGQIVLFRPYMNAKRHNNSNTRLCIPTIPEDDYVYYVKAVPKVVVTKSDVRVQRINDPKKTHRSGRRESEAGL